MLNWLWLQHPVFQTELDVLQKMCAQASREYANVDITCCYKRLSTDVYGHIASFLRLSECVRLAQCCVWFRNLMEPNVRDDDVCDDTKSPRSLCLSLRKVQSLNVDLYKMTEHGISLENLFSRTSSLTSLSMIGDLIDTGIAGQNLRSITLDATDSEQQILHMVRSFGHCQQLEYLCLKILVLNNVVSAGVKECSKLVWPKLKTLIVQCSIVDSSAMNALYNVCSNVEHLVLSHFAVQCLAIPLRKLKSFNGAECCLNAAVLEDCSQLRFLCVASLEWQYIPAGLEILELRDSGVSHPNARHASNFLFNTRSACIAYAT